MILVSNDPERIGESNTFVTLTHSTETLSYKNGNTKLEHEFSVDTHGVRVNNVMRTLDANKQDGETTWVETVNIENVALEGIASALGERRTRLGSLARRARILNYGIVATSGMSLAAAVNGTIDFIGTHSASTYTLLTSSVLALTTGTLAAINHFGTEAEQQRLQSECTLLANEQDVIKASRLLAQYGDSSLRQ